MANGVVFGVVKLSFTTDIVLGVVFGVVKLSLTAGFVLGVELGIYLLSLHIRGIALPLNFPCGAISFLIRALLAKRSHSPAFSHGPIARKLTSAIGKTAIRVPIFPPFRGVFGDTKIDPVLIHTVSARNSIIGMDRTAAMDDARVSWVGDAWHCMAEHSSKGTSDAIHRTQGIRSIEVA